MYKRIGRAGVSVANKARAKSFEDSYIPEPNSGCWLWIGPTDNNGYGLYCCDGRRGAHRESWTRAFGHPGKLHVLHKCDNPPCVNPDHLFLGTQLDNNRDMYLKGRVPKGERAGRAKLTEAQVIEIRNGYNNLSLAKIGKLFGVTAATIDDLRRGRSWKHLLEPPFREAGAGWCSTGVDRDLNQDAQSHMPQSLTERLERLEMARRGSDKNA